MYKSAFQAEPGRLPRQKEEIMKNHLMPHDYIELLSGGQRWFLKNKLNTQLWNRIKQSKKWHTATLADAFTLDLFVKCEQKIEENRSGQESRHFEADDLYTGVVTNYPENCGSNNGNYVEVVKFKLNGHNELKIKFYSSGDGDMFEYPEWQPITWEEAEAQYQEALKMARINDVSVEMNAVWI